MWDKNLTKFRAVAGSDSSERTVLWLIQTILLLGLWRAPGAPENLQEQPRGAA